jgi:hypothetical protein
VSTGPCPSCGSGAVSRIVHGLLPEDGLEGGDVPGGCVVDGPSPDRWCRDCGHQWLTATVPLRWPDPRTHVDGARVEVGGTVGRVMLEATSRDDVWADFELLVDDRLPRLRCLAFPTVFASLDVALEPGLAVGLRGRISLSSPSGPELHVTDWA